AREPALELAAGGRWIRRGRRGGRGEPAGGSAVLMVTLLVESLLSRLPVLPFDLVVARVHARLWADLAGQGVNVGAHDLLIAATAIAAGGAMATRDQRSFPRIPGLVVHLW